MHTALWLSTLHGMGATKTWYWCRNADGSPGRSQEEFYGSLLVQPRLLNEYGVGLAELNAFGKELVALEREPKQIYILYSEPSAIQSVNYINNQMAVYEALQFTGLPAGFVTENELRTTGLPAHCKWLIVADASHISRPALEWFQKYINGGGKTLIIGNSAFKYNEYGKPYNPAETGFLSGAGRLDVVSPEMLLRRIEAEMNKTSVTREIRCTDNSGKLTAFGVMCRSAEFKGGHLVCLINVSSVPKEVSLELNGKVVSRATDLFENSKQKIKSIKMDPLTIRLFQISK
jgi:beta-galactosidase